MSNALANRIGVGLPRSQRAARRELSHALSLRPSDEFSELLDAARSNADPHNISVTADVSRMEHYRDMAAGNHGT